MAESLIDLGGATSNAIHLAQLAQADQRLELMRTDQAFEARRLDIMERNSRRTQQNAQADETNKTISHLLDITKNPLTQHTSIAVEAMARVESMLGIRSDANELRVGLDKRRAAVETALSQTATQEQKMNAYIEASVTSPSLTTQMLEAMEKSGTTGLKQYQILNDLKLQEGKIRELNQKQMQIEMRNGIYATTGGLLNRFIDATNAKDAEGKRSFGPTFSRLLNAKDDNERRIAMQGSSDLGESFKAQIQGLQEGTNAVFTQIQTELGPLKGAVEQAKAEGREVLPEDLAKVKTLDLVEQAKTALDAWTGDPYNKQKWNRLQTISQQVRMAAGGTAKELSGVNDARQGMLDETRRKVDLQYANAERERLKFENKAAAQVEFGKLPSAAQTKQNAAKIAGKYKDVLPEDVMQAIKDPNKPMVQVDLTGKASEEAAKEFTKETRVTYNQLKNAPVLLRNIDEAKALIPQAKGFMGPGGETLMEAAKFLNNRLNAKINTQGIKNAEELRTRIFFNIMENLKKMDAQPSQMQQQLMMDALGKLGTDPNALSNVLDAYGDTIRDKVEIFNKEIEGAEQRGTVFPYDPRIELPERSGEAVIKTDVEFERLPSGAVFIGPDGRKRRKP